MPTYTANNFSFGQSIGVTGAGVGFLGNISRMGSQRLVRSRIVLPTTATNLPFGQGAVQLSYSSAGANPGGAFQGLVDFLATPTNAQYLQQYWSGIAVRNVKTTTQFLGLMQPALTTVSTTMTGTAAASTVTVASATGIVVGMTVEGYGIAAQTIVTGVSSTTITLNNTNLYTINSGTAVTFVSPSTSFVTGSFAPGQEADVLLEGSTTVQITNGTPENNWPVYIRTVANASLSGTFVGDFEAAADLATSAITIAATTLGSTSVTTSGATGLAAGQYITSPLFPLNTYIVSGATTSWVFSQPANQTVSTATVAMSAYNTALLGSPTDPWVRFSTGQIDNNGVAEVTVLRRQSA